MSNIRGQGPFARERATWTGKAGNPKEAVRQLTHLVDIATEHRGTDDEWTLSLRRHLAHWTGEAGDPHEAVRQLERLSVDVNSDRKLSEAVQGSLEHWRNRTIQ